MQPRSPGSSPRLHQLPEFADPVTRSPLVSLRDTERSLRMKTVDAIVPWLPERAALNLGEASLIADESLDELAEIDLGSITDAELKPARMQVGLLFLAFGALAMAFLSLCLYLVHPHLNVNQQLHHYWYQYVWFVGLGISGLFMIGREAMRPVESLEEWSEDWDEPSPGRRR